MNSTEAIVEHSPQQGRSIAEMTVKAIALVAATTIAVGHLTTLRRQPVKLASYQVIATILIPAFPLSEIAISACRTWNAWKRRHGNSPKRYHLCAALDQRAIAASPDGDEVTVPLSLVPCQSLSAHRESYDLRWFARLVIISVFMLQAFLTVWLWVRRFKQRARTYLDDYMALGAFGGLVNALVSASITVLNTTWQATERYHIQLEERFIEPSALDLLYQFAWRTTFVELRLSLIVGIVLRSLLLRLNRSSQTKSIHDSAGFQCTKPIQVLAGFLPTSQGLKWETVATASCHPQISGIFQGLLGIAAAVGFSLALLSVFCPVLLLISLVLRHVEATKRLSRRTRESIFSGVVDQCGKIYAGLNLGILAVAIWDLSEHRTREYWMWQDPWSERFWTF